MYRPPPLRGQPVLANKKVLLIDRNQPTRDVRVRILQSHGVEVHAAKDVVRQNTVRLRNQQLAKYPQPGILL
jgi:CheY-like chemotaxis protein